MVYACITSHKAVIMLFNQYSLPLTGRILTYMYIYIIAEHLPMAHQYEATLGGAHTEHVRYMYSMYIHPYTHIILLHI